MRTRPPRLPRRLLAVTAGLALIAGLAGAAPAHAHGVPGDRPLPGYTIDNPPLPPALVHGQPSRVRQGVHRHAAYTIEVPPRWNGELLMWAHGYRGQGSVLTVDPPGFGLRQRVLDQGYAWAASSYSGNGFDIRAGVLGTRELAQLFGELVRRPHRTYLAGVSMGGYIIGRSLEQYPGFYDGALPMCGVMGDQTLLDFFLDYNLVAQALAGVPAYPLPADYLSNAVPRIQARLGLGGMTPTAPEPANDLGRQLRAITVERSGGPRPGADAAFAVWKDFLFGISATAAGQTPAQRPGQLATNVFTRYQPNSPVNVNAAVRRVAPENLRERLSPALTQVPRIDGRPSAPVLSLHGLGDLFVPFSMEQAYRTDVARHGRSGLLVQRAIRTAQHCEFSDAEVGTAWEDLVRWVRSGHRPGGDPVADRAVVSRPDYGCRFSDPAAYAGGVGTRRLYPACR
ncbi:hypothetical protein [Micromonospora sp. NPDC049679]|uniref:hypothetical protein n=1 Tax=Micromonospora sp. NPDC049679 TaxID=3155920 RepID=UPI0033E04F89